MDNEAVASARSLVRAAQEAEEVGHLETAARDYEAAARLIHGANAAWAFHSAAVMWRRAGDAEMALALVRAALAQDERSHRAFSSQLALTLAHALADLGLWQDSAQAAMDASAGFQASGSTIEQLYAEVARARALAGLGEEETAAAVYHGLAARSRPPEIRSQALNNLGLLSASVGRWDEAADWIRQDIELCDAGGDAYGGFIARANLAKVWSDAGRRRDARAVAVEALNMSSGFESTPGYELVQTVAATAP